MVETKEKCLRSGTELELWLNEDGYFKIISDDLTLSDIFNIFNVDEQKGLKKQVSLRIKKSNKSVDRNHGLVRCVACGDRIKYIDYGIRWDHSSDSSLKKGSYYTALGVTCVNDHEYSVEIYDDREAIQAYGNVMFGNKDIGEITEVDGQYKVV